ncbi:MAG: glycosyltransferase family 9 protein [Caldimicrobium sp.]|nr:glycosyltransferase family 9 protein [Caldimicrobium sp.]MCX7613307.1 glycosyltransferase family 9 protein [Caldimicrobium sp.]MDW8183412.1 glycosyltransferase family 9 protein [Caldimicrobium sp.]
MGKRVLIYRRGGLGDTLLTFPILEILKNRDFQIVFLGNEDYIHLAKYFGLADEVYSSEYLTFLKKQPFDRMIIISQDGNLKPFPKERIWLPLYYLQELNLVADKFSRFLPSSKCNLPREKKALLHPGSGSQKKNPPFTLFRKIEQFLKERNYQVQYLFGPAEEDRLLDIKESGTIQNLIYERDIIEITNLFNEVELYVGNDSGISHLASYQGVKCYLFYGPSDEVVFGPIGQETKVISLSLPCRPCFPKDCEERLCLDVESLWQAFLKSFDDFP